MKLDCDITFLCIVPMDSTDYHFKFQDLNYLKEEKNLTWIKPFLMKPIKSKGVHDYTENNKGQYRKEAIEKHDYSKKLKKNHLSERTYHFVTYQKDEDRPPIGILMFSLQSEKQRFYF